MDDDFENIILDEEDNLNGLESLREKTNKKENENKKNEEMINNNNKIINNIEIKKQNEEKEKEISEEYNDFNYNISDNKETSKEKTNSFKEIKQKEINDEIININQNKEINLINNDLNNNNEINSLNDKKKEENNISNITNNEVSNNSFNIIQIIEDNFISLKNELETILSKVEFNEIKEIIEQNSQLNEYITKFNEIMNSIYKIFPKGEKLLTEKISKIRRVVEKTPKTREEKLKRIIEIYKNEYIDLENKNKLIKDPIYKQSLLNYLNKLRREYEIISDLNKKLKEEQKLIEIEIEKKSKNNKKEKNDVQRIEKDINNIKAQMNLLKNKINKNKINIIENNKRINKYVDKEKNLDYIAKNKYGIKQYLDVNINQNNEIKKFQEKKNSLKKISIYEKGIETNKAKYEREIRNNEIIINNLKKEKNKLLYYYKELIGEKKFKNIIQNFKEENKDLFEKNISKSKTESLDSNNKEESNIISNEDNKDNKDNKDNILLLKENNNININNTKEKKFPQFLDFFKEEENNEINNDEINNNENETEILQNEEKEENEQKEEKEINITNMEEINSITNRNKEYEDEPPPNEYEELEEFQI